MSGPIQFTKDMLGAATSPQAEPLTQTQALVPARKSLSKGKFETQNVLKLAKARLKDVKLALRRLSALEKERGELERLIQAAEDTKPRLKKVAG